MLIFLVKKSGLALDFTNPCFTFDIKNSLKTLTFINYFKL
jgi:hypothetical protein